MRCARRLEATAMFTETVEQYDLIYRSMKDYRDEAAKVAELVKSKLPGARRLLDVACGTGEHAKYLTREFGFEVDGIDVEPAFVDIARKKNPDGLFKCADMIDFSMGSQYDAVLCLFSSIGYVRDRASLRRALASMFEHVASGGLLIVEPWFEPGSMQDGRSMCVTAERDGKTISRTSHTRIVDRISRLQFEYVIGDSNGLRRASEVHELGLFTQSEMMEAFGAAGAEVEFEEEGLAGRGLYVAKRS